VPQRKVKTGRSDVSNNSLVGELFTLKPPQIGKPRLRVSEDDGSETYTSLQEGAMYLGRAVFKLLRNPLSHGEAGMARQEAVEALGAISTFARIVDQSKVVTAGTEGSL
jgi:hypothetical protein